jgi:lysophospholipase L1-like esterase
MLLTLALLAAQPAFPPPKTLGPTDTYGRHLARSMHLLASSTPDRRNTVRVLFYGQSITEQAWTKAVAADLKARFPHADLVVENRAIGGHSSQKLVRTAEADLYPFKPDLVIFHVYGAHDDYERIIKNIRERTCADILQQTDHLAAKDEIGEETDPAKLSPKAWNPWMNAVHLPAVSKRYGTELADVRGLWKRYLTDHGLKPQALLRDGVHLNAHGEYLMAEIVKAYLRPTAAPADGRVKTVPFTGELKFTGTRIDATVTGAPGEVRIDGRRPSDEEVLYANTRTTAFPGSNWPCLLSVEHDAVMNAEEWTLTVTELTDDHTGGKFTVRGSVTGPDGEGEVGKSFLSKSGRVWLRPNDWNLDYCKRVFKRPRPLPFDIKWKTYLRGADKLPGKPGVVTLADGLPPGDYTLTVTGGGVTSVTVYNPAGGRP